MSLETIIGLGIGIPAIILITLVAIILLLSLLLVKSRKKGAHIPDPVVYETIEGTSSPDPVMFSENAAYGLTKENKSGGNGEYETIEDFTPDPVVISENAAYGLTKENTSGGNGEYETIEEDFTPDPVFTDFWKQSVCSPAEEQNETLV